MNDTVKSTQREQVYDYMKNNGSIDPFRAFSELGILRLGARIWDLRSLGVPIKSQMKSNPDTGKRWKEYWLA